MFKIKSFQRRILTALMGIGLVPATLLLLLGIWTLQFFIGATGSAGPWGPLAESGQGLLDAVAQVEATDSAVAAAAAAHREALSGGLRNSQLFELIANRVLTLLPFVALGVALLIGGLSFWVARQLSRGFSRPIHDLVGWTELIGRNEDLPPPGPAEARGVQEFTLLRQSLRTMADDLETGRLEAIQSEKLRSWTEMARKVAHELKNPLAPMRMAAGSIARLEGKVAQEASDVLLEEIARLDEMARTFSQLGKMPEGPPSEVDIVELLDLLIQQHEGVGATLHFAPTLNLPLVTGHYDALLRSFRNLLLNALDAAGENGEVHVRAWSDGDWVSVEIEDTGPGIPPEHMDEIWQPDFTTKNRGTGLGLTMVRQTISAHQGRVHGRNNPDGGAVFLVELPV
jgi:two-component system nitrogen regulation sensor histidine kinase NtrY